MLVYALQAGEFLTRAKTHIPHGGWQTWVQEKCGIAPSTAADYMRIYDRRQDVDPLIDPKSRPAGVFSIKRILKLLATPRPETATTPRSDGTKTPAKEPHQGRGSGSAGAANDQAEPAGAEPEIGPTSDDPSPAPEEQGEPDIEAEARRQTGRADAARRRGEGADDAAAPRTREAGGVEERADDASWLEPLPVRSKLADPSIFDEEALLWRRLQPAVARLRELHEPSEEDIRKCGVKSWREERYAYMVARFVGVKHPGDWCPCHLCKGSGASSSLKKECDLCKGAGFEVTHASDPPDAGTDD